MDKQFQTIINWKNQIIRNHLVYGQALLPGLAYIDMLFQIAQKNGFDVHKIVLKKLSIFNPLIIREDLSVELTISFKEHSGYYKILVEGMEKGVNGASAQTQKKYISAEFHPYEEIYHNQIIDIKDIKERAKHMTDLEESIYAPAREKGLVHQDIIKAEGKIFLTDEGALIDLAVPAKYIEDADDYIFHPALIDGSAMAASMIIQRVVPIKNDNLFLPLFYESFFAIESLQTHCYARVQGSSVKAVNDIVYFDIEFFSEKGNKVGVLKRLTSKRVRLEEQFDNTIIREPLQKKITRISKSNITSSEPQLPRDKAFSDKNLESILTGIFAKYLEVKSYQVNTQVGFFELGLESAQLLEAMKELENVLDTTLSPTLLFEYNSIEELIAYLEQEKFDKESSCRETTTRKLVNDTIIDSSRELSNSNQAVMNQFKEMDIAIVGLAGRYPHARTIQDFWKNLLEGKDCITEIPRDRWDHSLYFDEDKDKPGKTYCKWGGFLEGVNQFDPLFFNISPRYAEFMDPQERLFLECIWDLFESIGYTQNTLDKMYQSNVGVYVGAMYQQYQLLNSDLISEVASSISSYGSIANRVSYFFNFQGPSMVIDTMCSSSAVAIHMACESLLRGECQAAIAGGVNLSLHPKKYLGLSMAKMLGSGPNTRSFGMGDGFLPSEGIGAVLLKPLSKAVQDGDSILAVIKSTTINHGGHANGFSVPSQKAQTRMIRDNFIKSGIDPRRISYVEAAANGSPLGDAVEVNALTEVFREYTSDKQFCAIGSVKSNIGHAEAASGISQLTKVIMQIQHKQLVPSIKAEPLNPNINFDNTPFYLQRELQEWKRPVVMINGEENEFPRCATVSSFGAGGSNAHLIVEEYIPVQKERIHTCSIDYPHIAVFSAKNRNRLVAVVEQMLEFIEIHEDIPLLDIIYTLQVGREAMESRLAMIVSNRKELIQGMNDFLESNKEGIEIKASIPIFSADRGEDDFPFRSLFFGKVGNTVAQILLAEKKLEEITNYWTLGGNIPWEILYGGQEVHKIYLPTYPFEKRLCWIDSYPEVGTNVEQQSLLNSITKYNETIDVSLSDLVIDIISHLSGIIVPEVNLNETLDRYGIDSIMLMKLFQQLQIQVDTTLTLDRLQECETTQDIINVLQAQKRNNTINMEQRRRISSKPTNGMQFPELIHLNQSYEGRPVFWIHAGLGGVEVYQAIAQKIDRPFYGIQARGWMTERIPLNGIQAMASYYIHIIQSVEPDGPYDLGGYSLGGVLAYEITRQLQELGQSVHKIIMVDSLDSTGLKKIDFSEKTLILQAVNMMLSANSQKPGHMNLKLIHRDEVNPILENEMFLKELFMLAKEHGLVKPETQFYFQIQQYIKIQQAYNVHQFDVLPLTDPQALTCYYFRNKNGVFFGDLEPYSSIVNNEVSLDNVNYWREWEEQLLNLYMIDVDSSAHMRIFAEAKSYELITSFCEMLYCRREPSTECVETFIKNMVSQEVATV